MAYLCRIELDGIEPKIWREFQFHPKVTFHQLHEIIQWVKGWEDDHLYEFHVNDRVIAPTVSILMPMEEDQEKWSAEREIVKDHVKHEGTAFTYIYDLGDEWEHSITLIKIDSTVANLTPLCLGGARSCPPEDVGGVSEYEKMLEIFLNPGHPEHEDAVEWIGEDFDFEYFSCENVNLQLQKQKDRLIPVSHLTKKPVKLTKSALNKHLKQLGSDELIELVKACYDASKDMEKFLAVRILGDEAVESLFDEYRKKVEWEFFPERGDAKLRLQEAKKAITEFKRFTGNLKYTLELKLIYVEMGVSFTLAYGDIDERFYYSMESMYVDVIDTVNKHETSQLFDTYRDRLEKIVLRTRGIGGWFHENLAELYAQLRWLEDDE